MACLLLIGLILTSYWNSTSGQWFFDDFPNIVDNENIRITQLSWDQIQKTIHPERALWRPVVYASFAVNYYFSKYDPSGYLRVNLGIHCIAAVVLFLCIHTMLSLPSFNNRYAGKKTPIALVAAAFWAVNPIQVFAVTYIVQRMASLAGLFFILSLYLYLKARGAEKPLKKTVLFAGCLISALLAVGSKENAVVLPGVLLLSEAILIRTVPPKRLFFFTAGLVAAGAVLVLVNYEQLTDFVAHGYSKRPFTLVERCLTEPRVFFFYLSLMLYPLPSRLALLHDVPISKSLWDPWTASLSILALGLLVCLMLRYRKRFPLPVFCIGFFFMAHSVEGSFLPLELVFEHRNYLPSMMLFVPVSLAIVTALEHFSYSRFLRLLVSTCTCVIIISHGHTVYMRNSLMAYPLEFWKANLAFSQNLSIIWNNLGKEYWKLRDYDKACEHFARAAEIDWYLNGNQQGIAYHNLGLCAQYNGDLTAAYERFRKGIELSPGNTLNWAFLINIEIELGNLDTAEKHLRRANAARIDTPLLRTVRCKLLLARNDPESAIQEAFEILSQDQGNQLILTVLGQAFRQIQHPEKAIEYWNRFVQASPASIMGNLALIELGFLESDAQTLEKSIRRLAMFHPEKDVSQLLNQYKREESLITVYTPDRQMIVEAIKDYYENQAAEVSRLSTL